MVIQKGAGSSASLAAWLGTGEGMLQRRSPAVQVVAAALSTTSAAIWGGRDRNGAGWVPARSAIHLQPWQHPCQACPFLSRQQSRCCSCAWFSWTWPAVPRSVANGHHAESNLIRAHSNAAGHAVASLISPTSGNQMALKHRWLWGPDKCSWACCGFSDLGIWPGPNLVGGTCRCTSTLFLHLLRVGCRIRVCMVRRVA